MKNDTTFVLMRSGDHLGEGKMSRKGTSLRQISLFYFFVIDKNGLKKGRSTKQCSDFLIFA